MKTSRCLPDVALVLLLALMNFPIIVVAEEKPPGDSTVPFLLLFYHMDDHLLSSFTYDNGLDHLVAVPITFGIIRSGIDWKWNTYANERGISSPGFAAVEVGALAPIVVPLTLYLYGRSADNERLQITGLALGQAALLSVGVSSALKAFTGRRPPNDQNALRGTTDYSGDFHFGFLRRGAYDGWPSSHTMNAFAMAATLSSLYPESTSLHVASYSYAALVGIGVSTNIHWLSDAVAGALMGYAIGKVVGTGFRGLIVPGTNGSSVKVSVTPGGIVLAYNF